MMKTLRLSLCLLAFATTFASLQAQTPDDRLGSQIPAFSFPNVDGGNVTPFIFKANAPVIVVYFDPDCEHCQLEAQMINEKLAEFKDITLLFVAFHDPANIKAFRETYFPGANHSHLFFAADPNYQFDKTFGYSQAPCIHIYDKTWKKVKVFRNEVAPEELLKFAR